MDKETPQQKIERLSKDRWKRSEKRRAFLNTPSHLRIYCKNGNFKVPITDASIKPDYMQGRLTVFKGKDFFAFGDQVIQIDLLYPDPKPGEYYKGSTKIYDNMRDQPWIWKDISSYDFDKGRQARNSFKWRFCQLKEEAEINHLNFKEILVKLVEDFRSKGKRTAAKIIELQVGS